MKRRRKLTSRVPIINLFFLEVSILQHKLYQEKPTRMFGLVSQGCVFGLTGATLLDLGDVYAASPKVVSYTILTRGIGSIVFCLAGIFQLF